jgi:hypothetical protein
MKKLLLFALIAVIFSACDKKEQTILPSEAEVSFNISQMMDDGLKSGWQGPDWQCATDAQGNLLEPDYAVVTIDGVDYVLNVFRLPAGTGPLYTETMKFPVKDPAGPYLVTNFLLYNVNGTPHDLGDDIIVMATPTAGAPFSEYVTKPVEFEFNILPFEKLEIKIEVLCFLPQLYKEFGFGWFAINEIILREVCFFGDICIKFLEDYDGSLYEGQLRGLQHDMPAIFSVKVFSTYAPGPYPRTDDPDFMADNTEWLGEGKPLCVRYPDNLNIPDDEETFQFELWIYVADGSDQTGFSMKYFGTFDWTVADMLNPDFMGGDGVFEFVLGNCAYPGTDHTFAPYMNLPATCTLTTIPGTPGATVIQDGLPGYFDVMLSNIVPNGAYELNDGRYGINCFNRGIFISVPATYQMNVWNSLYPELIIGDAQNYEWDRVNWLINHTANYPGYTWEDLQYAFWLIEANGTWAVTVGVTAASGLGPITQVAVDMAAAAALHDGFVPLPGGWAAVVFEVQGAPAAGTTGDKVQCIFTRIDP